MKKIYTLLMAAALLMPFGLIAQNDTLVRYDESSIQAPPHVGTVGGDSWGYKYGHGGNGIKEVAEKYYIKEKHYVVGVMVLLDDFYFGVHSDDDAFSGVYDVQAKSGDKFVGAPVATARAKATMPMKDLKDGQNPTFFTFTDKVEVKDSFYVSFGFPGYDFVPSRPGFVAPEDTVAVMMTYTRDMDNDPNIYWKNAARYSQDNWENPFFIGSDKVNFCISPIITTEVPSDTTSIGDISMISGLVVNKVYPNPVADHVNVGLNLESNSKVQIAFYDLGGRSLGTNNFDLSAGTHDLSLNLNHSVDANHVFMAISTENGSFSIMLNTK